MNVLSQAVQDALGHTLDKAKRLIAQTGSRKTVDNRANLYSWHAPQVECISTMLGSRLWQRLPISIRHLNFQNSSKFYNSNN